MNFLGKHKFIVIIGVILAAGAAWYALSSSSAPPPDITNTTDTASGTSDQFLLTLQTLKTITIDTSIFSNPVFLNLTDFSTQIVPEPVGRADPFAPLSASAAPTPQSTQTAAIFTPKK